MRWPGADGTRVRPIVGVLGALAGGALCSLGVVAPLRRMARSLEGQDCGSRGARNRAIEAVARDIAGALRRSRPDDVDGDLRNLEHLDYYRAFQHIDNTELRLERLSGSIVFLDDVLTTSARMGALTGEPEWEARYKNFEPFIDTAIKQTIGLAPNAAVRQAAEQTEVANQRLVEMEHQSFDFAKRGRRDEARRLLDSPEYELDKAAYAEAVTVCKRAIESRVDEELQHHIRRALVGLALTLASLLTLVFGWAGVLRIVRRHPRASGSHGPPEESAIPAHAMSFSPSRHTSSRRHLRR